MKILVIFTGGTIGTVQKGKWLSTDDSTKYMLLSKYNNPERKVEFVTKSPYTVLSENLSAKELNILQKEISNGLKSDYDGIIVTHGTDTLHYTACAAEYAFSNCHIPVVFVSSAYPLENPKANGYINFEAALEFIRSNHTGGVFVSYKNENEDFVNIHIPTGMLQHAECNSDIYSIYNKPYATYNGKVKLNDVKLADNDGLGVITYNDNSEILVIDSHPGDSFSYSLDNIKAVIIKPFHSATLNTSNADFTNFCNRAYECKIPVFIVNTKSGISYESSKLFDDLAIISLPYCTYISAYVKLWAAVSLNQSIAEFMKINIANEYNNI